MSFKERWSRWSKEGLYLPFVFDPVDKIASPTLLFFYTGFFLAAIYIMTSSALMLAKGDLLTATFMPTLMALMGFVFYRLRKLDRVRFDLNDQEIELSSNPEEKEEK
jgi:hypothetical protein